MSPAFAVAAMTGCGRFRPDLPPDCGEPAGFAPSGLAKTKYAVPPRMQATSSQTQVRRHQALETPCRRAPDARACV